jgi:hypothetical protein
MSQKQMTSAQRRNRDHTIVRHKKKQLNRTMGAKAAFAAGLAAWQEHCQGLEPTAERARMLRF